MTPRPSLLSRPPRTCAGSAGDRNDLTAGVSRGHRGRAAGGGLAAHRPSRPARALLRRVLRRVCRAQLARRARLQRARTRVHACAADGAGDRRILHGVRPPRMRRAPARARLRPADARRDVVDGARAVRPRRSAGGRRPGRHLTRRNRHLALRASVRAAHLLRADRGRRVVRDDRTRPSMAALGRCGAVGRVARNALPSRRADTWRRRLPMPP